MQLLLKCVIRNIVCERQIDYFRQLYYMRFHTHTDQESIASAGMAQFLSYECV